MNNKRCLFCKKELKPKQAKQKFCSVICSNRFNLNNKNTNVKFPKKMSVQVAELFGALLGDGSVEKYFVKIYLNANCECGYALYLYHLCTKLFSGAKVSKYIRLARGTVEVQISSSEVSSYLLKIGFDPKIRSIPTWITDNDAYSFSALRGLFDTEGSIGVKYFHAKKGPRFYKQLTFTNKNSNILTFVETQLKKFGYKPTVGSKKNIYISNARDIQRYAKEVGSSNPKLIKKLETQVLNQYTYATNTLTSAAKRRGA